MATKKDRVSVEVEIKKIGEGLTQAKAELERLGTEAKGVKDKLKDSTRAFHDQDHAARTLGTSFGSLRSVIVGLGSAMATYLSFQAIKGLAGTFLEAAKTSEQYAVRLRVLLGSQEQANKLFDQLREYASKVPFEFREIMEAATLLSAQVEGGVPEVMKWMPIIGDLAAATGLGIQQTTEQIGRMFNAGIGAADTFREKGVLAFLGFKQGVTYEAEEIRKKLEDEWTKTDSSFKGATDELAGTWSGLTSMFADAWFMFRDEVMGGEGGLFGFIKQEMKGVLEEINRLKEAGKLKEWATETARAIATTFEITGRAVGPIIEVMTKAMSFFTSVMAQVTAARKKWYGILGWGIEKFGTEEMKQGMTEAQQQAGESAATWDRLAQQVKQIPPMAEAVVKALNERLRDLNQRMADFKATQEGAEWATEAWAVDFADTYGNTIASMNTRFKTSFQDVLTMMREIRREAGEPIVMHISATGVTSGGGGGGVTGGGGGSTVETLEQELAGRVEANRSRLASALERKRLK